MRKCPKCGHWSLDFDLHFQRDRCYDANCNYMDDVAGVWDLSCAKQVITYEKITENSKEEQRVNGIYESSSPFTERGKFKGFFSSAIKLALDKGQRVEIIRLED